MRSGPYDPGRAGRTGRPRGRGSTPRAPYGSPGSMPRVPVGAASHAARSRPPAASPVSSPVSSGRMRSGPYDSAGVTPLRRPARAEIVGSLLRPAALRAAIEAMYEPGHHALLAEERGKDLAALHRVEDDAIREAVRRQIELGLDVVSDGEFRRYMFTNSFYDAVDGVVTDNVVAFTNARGESVELAVHSVQRRLRRIGSPAAREAEFLAGITDHPFKVALPAASLFTHPFGVMPDAYESVEEFAAHAIAIERELGSSRGDRGRLRLHPARLRPLPVPRRRRLDEPLSRRRAQLRGSPRACARRRPQHPRGHPGRHHDRPPSLPRQLPLELALHRLARSSRRAAVLRAALRRVPDRVGRPRSRWRLRADPLRAAGPDRGDGARQLEGTGARERGRPAETVWTSRRDTSASTSSRSRPSAASPR